MEISVIPDTRFEEVIMFLRANFPDEPLNVGIGLCKKNVPCKLLENQDLRTLSDKMSLMVTDPDTGEIAGVALNGICRRGDIEETLESMFLIEDAAYHQIFGLLFGMNREANLFVKYDVQQIFELRILCVNPKYRGRGIAKRLFLRSEKIAEEHEFLVMKVDATSYFTQKIAEQIGMETVKEVNYKEYKDKRGRHIYTKIPPPHDSYKIMVKELGCQTE